MAAQRRYYPLWLLTVPPCSSAMFTGAPGDEQLQTFCYKSSLFKEQNVLFEQKKMSELII